MAAASASEALPLVEATLVAMAGVYRALLLQPLQTSVSVHEAHRHPLPPDKHVDKWLQTKARYRTLAPHAAACVVHT
jgi:hypothetical protein